MCRMILGAGEFDSNVLIDDFITMASDRNEKHEHNIDKEFKHGDGWGIAYLDNGFLSVHKSADSCYEDERINEFRELNTPLLLMHARRGSKGVRKLENVHPFRAKDHVFFHNGTVKEPLHFNNDYQPHGETDSEQLLYYLLSTNEPIISINSLAERLDKINNYSGMNTLLSDGRVTYVTNWFAYNPNYYTMKLLRTVKFVLISSEVLPGYKDYAWERLANRTILRVETNGLMVESRTY